MSPLKYQKLAVAKSASKDPENFTFRPKRKASKKKNSDNDPVFFSWSRPNLADTCAENFETHKRELI